MIYEVYKGITEDRLTELLCKISRVKIALIGDLCIDIYWTADMKKSELSRETPHFPLPVVHEYYQPGAGGNVIANLAALGVSDIRAISIIGNDWRGGLVKKCLQSLGISMDTIAVEPGRTTNAYCKPIRTGISDVVYEDPRIDFTGEAVTEEFEAQLIDSLMNIAAHADALCVSDQFTNGCVTKRVREKISSLAAQGLTVVVDSRDRICEYKNVILKPNEVEAASAVYSFAGTDINTAGADIGSFINAADILYKKLNCNISMTLGSRGNLQYYDGKAVHIVPKKVEGPIDICGSGDTFMAAYTCALAAGASPEEAGQFGSIAAEVTVSKTGQTGTASPTEILQRFHTVYK